MLVVCPVCNGATSRMFTAKVLGKYDAGYLYCQTCGFLHVQDPFWLEEAYNSPIAWADTGIAQRNILLSNVVSNLLYFLFEREGKYVDIAGGYGLFVRLMRDAGFDFYWSDKYTPNLLARGFDAELSPHVQYAAATAFEVMEHVVDPLDFIGTVFRETHTGTFIFSTDLFEGQPPRPDEWWYYSFETGQHVSFYQKRTLQFIAGKLNLQLHSHGMLHILTDRRINPVAFRLLASLTGSKYLSWIPKSNLPSRTVTDQLEMLSRGAGGTNREDS